jgi:uracil-DNA glycosylase family 4
MDVHTGGPDRIRLLLIQRLESLQRSGVLDLPRFQIAEREVPIQQDDISAQSHTLSEDGDADSSAMIAVPEPTVVDPPSPTVKPNENTEVPRLKRSARKSNDDERSAALAAMQIEVAACRRCEHLACTRTQTVFGVGNPRPRLCFMGEAPGADEDRRGEPFVGRAGQLLTDIIEKGMQLKRSDVYILNVLKCRPPDNRTPTDDEIANCREYFERQLEVLRPDFICLLGATAVRALLNSKQSMGRMRGQWFNYGDSRVMVTYHPSYLLRNPPAKKDTWEDIQMLMREMGLPIGKMG